MYRKLRTNILTNPNFFFNFCLQILVGQKQTNKKTHKYAAEIFLWLQLIISLVEDTKGNFFEGKNYKIIKQTQILEEHCFKCTFKQDYLCYMRFYKTY